jgi:hypothetical protein
MKVLLNSWCYSEIYRLPGLFVPNPAPKIRIIFAFDGISGTITGFKGRPVPSRVMTVKPIGLFCAIFSFQ